MQVQVADALEMEEVGVYKDCSSAVATGDIAKMDTLGVEVAQALRCLKTLIQATHLEFRSWNRPYVEVD